ncbi:MAG TPA: tripartite tricarboxylate transporter substrate binding protein [Burkholderiales bacterium]|nr:tripartite tricarboxylate transporter substrate binding protein [Burkholderiales bacterium]
MKWRLGCLAGICFAVSTAHALAQQGYPARPVRLIVPSSPGGGTDITARLIAPKLSEYLGQQVVVENRPGAGTMIGGEAVARAAPDGYTLLMGISTLAINPAIYRKVPYDALRDFVPVSQAVSLSNILVTHPSLPPRNVRELIAFARARPGQINYASAGVGTSPHLSMALFLSMTGLKMEHVPYKGSGPGVIDLVAGHVPVMMPNMLSALPHIKAGRLRAHGVTGVKRASGAPEIPTIAEAGVPGYEAVQWYGVLAPAGTSREIVAKLHGAVVRAVQNADVKARFLADGADPVGSSPKEFAAYIRAETAKWAKVVKDAGIRQE